MARNANWDRWTYASIAKHLQTEISSPLVFDFGGKRLAAWETASHRAEATIGGLRTRPIGSRTYIGECDVFVIVTSNLTADNYDHVDVAGDVANALDQCIEVMDYGATGLELISILSRKRGDGEFVSPDHLKPKDTDDRLHSTISVTYEGRYKL